VRPANQQEDDEIVKEDGNLLREDCETIKEDGDLHQEDDDLAEEDGNLLREDDEIAKEDDDLLKENGKIMPVLGVFPRVQGRFVGQFAVRNSCRSNLQSVGFRLNWFWIGHLTEPLFCHHQCSNHATVSLTHELVNVGQSGQQKAE
jgi:hypothetical protein